MRSAAALTKLIDEIPAREKAAKAADRVKGQRVAVTYRDEAGRKVAREVLLGVQAGEKSEKAKTQAPPHHH